MIDGDKIGILLVDDNSANLDELETMLNGAPFQAVRASNGAQALREVLANEFALAFLSIQMSDMDGVEAARLIRQQDLSAELPIIFVTSDFRPEHRKQCYEAGAVDFMVRPLDSAGLQAKLGIFAELYRFKKLLLERTSEFQQLKADSDETQRRELERERDALERFSNSQRGMAITARLHGERPLQESAPEIFTDLVSEYQDILEKSLDAVIHETGFIATDSIHDLATKMVFLSAGPRDVLQIHKLALAVLCDGRPQARVRATTEEGRFLLVELLGSILSLYRSMYKRHSGPYRPVNMLDKQAGK